MALCYRGMGCTVLQVSGMRLCCRWLGWHWLQAARVALCCRWQTGVAKCCR